MKRMGVGEWAEFGFGEPWIVCVSHMGEVEIMNHLK